jgi:hypothetical protein
MPSFPPETGGLLAVFAHAGRREPKIGLIALLPELEPSERLTDQMGQLSADERIAQTTQYGSPGTVKSGSCDGEVVHAGGREGGLERHCEPSGPCCPCSLRAGSKPSGGAAILIRTGKRRWAIEIISRRHLVFLIRSAQDCHTRFIVSSRLRAPSARHLSKGGRVQIGMAEIKSESVADLPPGIRDGVGGQRSGDLICGFCRSERPRLSPAESGREKVLISDAFRRMAFINSTSNAPASPSALRIASERRLVLGALGPARPHIFPTRSGQPQQSSLGSAGRRPLDNA